MKDNVELIVKAICTIIDHFFSRREEHVDKVFAKGNANMATMLNNVVEHGPAYFEKIEAMIDSTKKDAETAPTTGEA